MINKTAPNQVSSINLSENELQDSVSPKVKFQRNYLNYFSRLTRYIHNDDLKNAIKVANELKDAAAESGAAKIPDLIVSIKRVLYEGNMKKASALLDEMNMESSKYFMKNPID